MSVGDLVFIVASGDVSKYGIGIYLGRAHRGPHPMEEDKRYYAFLWKGRIATFDSPFWDFEVISEAR